MNETTTDRLIRLMAKKLDAVEGMAFSGRVESFDAIFEAFQLGERDCVFVSALTPAYVVKAILARGAVPTFCDVTPDSLTMDSRALEAAVRQTMASEQLYPRAVIADHFGGMPCALRSVKALCDRMGMVLIENCEEGFGGVSDGVLCGAAGDYSVISLGGSSVFGTGGSGTLVFSFGDSPLHDGIVFCDGEGYQSLDPIYGDALLTAFDRMDEVLERSRAVAKQIDDALAGSDFWIQRAGNSRQKSSFGALAIVAQSDVHRERALSFLRTGEMGRFVRPLHHHQRACFEKGCRGFRDIENAAALAPRAFRVDIFGALHGGQEAKLLESFAEMGREITE